MQKVEMTYLECAWADQQLRYPSRHAYGVIGPRRRCGHIKTEPRNVSRMQNGGRTYLGHIIVIRSLWRPIKGIRRAKELTFKSSMPGEHWCKDRRLEIKCISVNQVGEGKTTYCGHARITQPPGNISKWLHRVYKPSCQCGHIKTAPTNVNQMERNRNTYLEHVNALQLIWRPGKQIRRVSKLTTESRMMGEPWHDINDYGWRPVWVAINGRHMGMMWLPNSVTWRASHTNGQTFATTSLKYHSYWTQFLCNTTFYCIQLSTSIWLLLSYFLSHHTTSFMGECWS